MVGLWGQWDQKLNLPFSAGNCDYHWKKHKREK